MVDRVMPAPREREVEPPSVPQLLHDLAVATARADLAIREKLGLNPTDYQAIKHLIGSPEPIGPVGLGRLLGISSGSATSMVDRLERDGHVERRPHPVDRRRQTLAVSRTTADDIAVELQPLADALSEFALSFTPAERQVIERFLSGALHIHRGAFT
jgi:DNA-binding MarR family transcriptional regulator